MKVSAPQNNISTPIDIYGDPEQIERVFRWMIGVILIAQILAIIIVLTNDNYMTAIYVGISILPVLLSLLFVRKRNYETVATFLAIMLLSLVTILATFGQGIHHLGNLGYPAVLIVASLVTRKRTLSILTLFTIGCVAWLVFGELYGIYTPRSWNSSVVGDFFIATLVIVVTAFFSRLLTETLFLNNLRLKQELRERQIAEEKLEGDMALRLQAEEKIRQLNLELEQRVQERTAQLAASNEELEAFNPALAERPQIVVGNKTDLIGEEDVTAACDRFRAEGIEIDPISVATGAGLRGLVLRTYRELERLKGDADEAVALPTRRKVYRFQGETGFRVDRNAEGFVVSGVEVENLVRKLVLDSRDAMEYLSDRLERMGVMKELRKRGFSAGDTVRIGEAEFELEG